MQQVNKNRRSRTVIGIIMALITLSLFLVCAASVLSQRYYKGCYYNHDYSKLIRCETSLDDIEFHPNLQIIGNEAFGRECSGETLVIPWGVTTLEPEAFAHIQMVTVLLPDTVVHFSDENVFYERQWSNYLCSYYTAARKSLHCDARPLVENPELWYEAYGISEEDLDNWICRNGRLYYLFRTELYSGTYHKMATGPQTIDGVSYLFDESGALQQADLPAGNYTFGEVSFTVDQDGKVKAK